MGSSKFAQHIRAEGFRTPAQNAVPPTSLDRVVHVTRSPAAHADAHDYALSARQTSTTQHAL